MKKKKKLGKGQIVLHAAFILLVLMYVVPFVLTISISFSDETSLIRNGYSLIPHEFSLEAYKMVFRNPGQILQSYKVTILFTVVATALAVLVMGVMAYPLSRPTFRFRGPLSFFVLFTMLFSGGMIPGYIVWSQVMHVSDTIFGLICPNLMMSAFNVILMRTYFTTNF